MILEYAMMLLCYNALSVLILSFNLKQCLRFFHVKFGMLCHYVLKTVIPSVFSRAD